MQSSDIPARFPIPFASGASGGFIRSVPKDHVDATSTDAPASLHDGFPPETFTSPASGGIPPSGADFNGLLNQITAWARWQAAGVPALFNTAFSSAIGGYPKYAVVASTSPGKLFMSIAENNTTDPDSLLAADWTVIASDFGTADNFYTLPNGKVEQWGYVFLSSTGEPVVDVSLVTPFADAFYNISLTPSVDAPSSLKDTWIEIIRNSKTATGFSVQYQHVSSGSASTPGLDGFEWRCVGRAA